MVEFALILPILVMFVFGIVQFGKAYSARIELTSAVREGARAAALGGTADAARAATVAAAPGLKPALTVGQVVASDCTANPLPANATATVVATYSFPYTIPLFRNGTWTLSATGVMQCGG